MYGRTGLSQRCSRAVPTKQSAKTKEMMIKNLSDLRRDATQTYSEPSSFVLEDNEEDNDAYDDDGEVVVEEEGEENSSGAAAGHHRHHHRSRNNGGGVLALGLALLVLGGVGLLFGRIIKACVSRQREYLADASAVQFTRNPDGIGGALKMIGAHAEGSRMGRTLAGIT